MTCRPDAPLRRVGRRLPAAALAAALAGCGGGVFVGFGFGDDDFDLAAPAVSLSVGVASAPAGASVVLNAAASDAHGIDNVAFFELDGAGGSTLLGADGAAPFQWTAVVPARPGGSVSFFARATDGTGRRGDSAVVTISIEP